tara:strand:- start:2495 stop:2932 length:438 start_codon:yes stop_codon:yes gene_type:complete
MNYLVKYLSHGMVQLDGSMELTIMEPDDSDPSDAGFEVDFLGFDPIQEAEVSSAFAEWLPPLPHMEDPDCPSNYKECDCTFDCVCPHCGFDCISSDIHDLTCFGRVTTPGAVEFTKEWTEEECYQKALLVERIHDSLANVDPFQN